MIVVKPTTQTPEEKRAAIQQVLDQLHAKHPHRFVNCPSCEGVGYHETPWGAAPSKVPCPCCDGSGLVLPEEADDWFRFNLDTKEAI